MVNLKASLTSLFLGIRFQRRSYSFLDSFGQLMDELLYYKGGKRNPKDDFFFAYEEEVAIHQLKMFNTEKGTFALVNPQDFHYGLRLGADPWSHLKPFTEDAKALWSIVRKYNPDPDVDRIGLVMEWSFVPKGGDASAWFRRNNYLPDVQPGVVLNPLVRYEIRTPLQQSEIDAVKWSKYRNVIMSYRTNHNPQLAAEDQLGAADKFVVNMDYQHYVGEPIALKPPEIESHIELAAKFALDRVQPLLSSIELGVSNEHEKKAVSA